ncbi:MAG: radical SAM protein [Candidatus Woesearchaeota archaeon]
MEFSFELIKFHEKKEHVRCFFMTNFYFDVQKSYLDALGPWYVQDQKLYLDTADAQQLVDTIIEKGLQELYCTVTKNPTIYLHRNCGIPLIGNGGFGVVDRGTNIIEIKPVTGCNLGCTYCSLSEGTNLKKREFLIEADYLVDYITLVLEQKDLLKPTDDVEIHFAVHGEPFIYGDMLYLCKEIRKIPSVKIVSVDTNGTFLTPTYIDELAQAGMTRINLSLDSMNQQKANTIADRFFPLQKILNIAKYLSKHPHMQCLIAPVWVRGLNDEDMEHILNFCKEHNIVLGIQNYLNYKGGRYLNKQDDWQTFFDKLKVLEQKHNHKLVFDFYKDFNIRPVQQIPKPFKRKQVIAAVIACQGRHEAEMLAVAQDRVITIPKCSKKIGDRVNVRITGDKHNIFWGELV